MTVWQDAMRSTSKLRLPRKNDRMSQSCSARQVLFPRGGKFSTCPGVEEGGADRPQWFAGCGMLVAGGFCYRSLVDESRIARESQNSPDSCACLRPAPQHLEWLRAEQTAAFCAASNPASPRRRAAAFTPRSGFLRYATPRPRDSPIPEGRSRPPRRWRSMAVVPCRA